ncbi:MAG TPA: alpha/beta hydrolase [Acidimicrobiales bacterium]|nr:alpha/beta hydrolase [Acidimicrobiales bacterium]
MARFERDGVTLAYDDTGEDDLTPVLMLHGLSSARSTWDPLTWALGGEYRVLALDHRGHGESSHAPGTYDLDHYGPDTIAFGEEVVGRPALLVGHSLGGVIAAYVGRERPDLAGAVVLEDPPLYRGDPAEATTSRIAAFFPVLRRLLADLQARSAQLEDYEAMLRSAPALNGSGTMADVLGPHGTRAQARAWASLDPEVFTPAIDGSALRGAHPEGPLKCPAWVLRADPSLGAAFTPEDEARFLATNPDATVELVGGASHVIHDEQPGRMLEVVRRALAGIGAS